MKSILKITTLSTLIATPLFAFAALEGVGQLITSIGALIKLALPIAVAAALLFFFWGVANFILKAGDPKAREEGRNRMLWGIIALFVMISVWGIVAFIQDNLDIYGGDGIETPDGDTIINPPTQV